MIKGRLVCLVLMLLMSAVSSVAQVITVDARRRAEESFFIIKLNFQRVYDRIKKKSFWRKL